MPAPEKLDPSDAMLLRYLLGVLPVDEAEPIEEASIVDDDLAARLDTMERELVDSYVRGEMDSSGLAKFQSWYLSSPLRVQKVEAARAIQRIAEASAGDLATNVAPVAHAAAIQETNPETATDLALSVSPAPSPMLRTTPGLSYGQVSDKQNRVASRLGKFGTWPALGLAAIILILIATFGVFFSKSKQARNEVAETGKGSSTPVTEQHATAASNGDKTGATGVQAHGAENIATVTLFLPAPTRGASTIPKVDVPAGTGLVVLSLGLGSTGEDSYRVQLMNPTTQKVLWRSGILRPGSDGTYVSAAVPGNVLRSQVYLVQLTHDAANGKPELLGTYPFRAEVK